MDELPFPYAEGDDPNEHEDEEELNEDDPNELDFDEDDPIQLEDLPEE